MWKIYKGHPIIICSAIVKYKQQGKIIQNIIRVFNDVSYPRTKNE
jgi:hypothetical protein